MKFKKTNDAYADLIQKLKTHGYSKSYITRLETEINWLIRSQDRENIQSYTTMRYLDITTDDKRKALATLEGKKEKNVTKKMEGQQQLTG